eukprot:CAMPEP_0176021456 /NCGR_PEP_ID=MMETSP0120_2-20121206/10418_1 /TAXON_ID=160619 /ORGANISM="Kryptoperidinium foliaceum, Strain CCMP 1326" /LENGTH=378 /DNA_ID=CAMNT_0017354569 /DNA_START=1 /DNA_END=1133 /DNA_ORIENTATION=-
MARAELGRRCLTRACLSTQSCMFRGLALVLACSLAGARRVTQPLESDPFRVDLPIILEAISNLERAASSETAGKYARSQAVRDAFLLVEEGLGACLLNPIAFRDVSRSLIDVCAKIVASDQEANLQARAFLWAVFLATNRCIDAEDSFQIVEICELSIIRKTVHRRHVLHTLQTLAGVSRDNAPLLGRMIVAAARLVWDTDLGDVSGLAPRMLYDVMMFIARLAPVVVSDAQATTGAAHAIRHLVDSVAMTEEFLTVRLLIVESLSHLAHHALDDEAFADILGVIEVFAAQDQILVVASVAQVLGSVAMRASDKYLERVLRVSGTPSMRILGGSRRAVEIVMRRVLDGDVAVSEEARLQLLASGLEIEEGAGYAMRCG